MYVRHVPSIYPASNRPDSCGFFHVTCISTSHFCTLFSARVSCFQFRRLFSTHSALLTKRRNHPGCMRKFDSSEMCASAMHPTAHSVQISVLDPQSKIQNPKSEIRIRHATRDTRRRRLKAQDEGGRWMWNAAPHRMTRREIELRPQWLQ